MDSPRCYFRVCLEVYPNMNVYRKTLHLCATEGAERYAEVALNKVCKMCNSKF